MDILIKNNIIKRNKLIIDIGMFATKLVYVRYASKVARIVWTKVFDNKSFISNGLMDYNELVKKIDNEIPSSMRKDISVSLPAELCENKIISIKNKKESDIPKLIRKEYMTFGRVNPITHVVDYAYLGKREEQGDTVFYYLISAVAKSTASEMMSIFLKHKLKVHTLVSSVYTQICLSKLFYNDYEYLDRLMIDFGTHTTRITAISEGIAVYTRVLDYGFESYVDKIFMTHESAGKPEILRALHAVGDARNINSSHLADDFSLLDEDTYFNCIAEVDDGLINDISRVIDLCSNNDIGIKKIYVTGHTLKGFTDKLKTRLGVETETVMFGKLEEKDGENYTLETEDVDIDSEYANALGLVIYPFI